MLIVRAPRTDPPTHDELASMHMSRNQAFRLVARLKARQKATLRNTGGGSYRVVLQRTGTTHADFTDLPFVQAQSRQERAARVRILQVVRSYTRAFFDKTLRGIRSPLLEGKRGTGLVEAVDTFEPAAGPDGSP
jgi:hypothetical protein